jgi:hypothetical protein
MERARVRCDLPAWHPLPHPAASKKQADKVSQWLMGDKNWTHSFKRSVSQGPARLGCRAAIEPGSAALTRHMVTAGPDLGWWARCDLCGTLARAFPVVSPNTPQRRRWVVLVVEAVWPGLRPSRALARVEVCGGGGGGGGMPLHPQPT